MDLYHKRKMSKIGNFLCVVICGRVESSVLTKASRQEVHSGTAVVSGAAVGKATRQ